MTGRHRAVWLLLSAVLVPVNAAAQTPAASFDLLERIVRPGDAVVVVDSSGARTKGIVRALSAASLSIQTSDSDARTFPQSSVVSMRRTDGLMNGILIGLGIGAGVGLAGFASTYHQGTDAVYFWGYVGVWLCPAVGAAIGALADRAIGNEVLYVAPPRAGTGRVGVSPIARSRAAGVTVSVRF